jgi:hypothetical protein
VPVAVNVAPSCQTGTGIVVNGDLSIASFHGPAKYDDPEISLLIYTIQLTACAGVLLWALIDTEHSWKLYLQFFVFAWGVFASRVWTALLAVTLVLIRIRPLSDIIRLRRHFAVIGWV